MNYKIKLAKSINLSEEKDDNYYLFKGILNNLDPASACEIVDLKFNQNKIIRNLIIEKVVNDLKKEVGEHHIQLCKKLIDAYKKEKVYRKKESCSIFLLGMCIFLPTTLIDEIIKLFANSKYTYDHRRALELISKNWKDKYIEIVVFIFNNYSDGIEVILENFPEKYIFDNLSEIEEYLGDDIESDYQLRNLRNRIYAKIAEYIPDKIQKLKIDNPISYIFIMKESGNKIDEKFAIETYIKYPSSRKYLPSWFGQMKLWNVFQKLINQFP